MELPSKQVARLLRSGFAQAELDMTHGHFTDFVEHLRAKGLAGKGFKEDYLYRSLYLKLGDPPYGNRSIVVGKPAYLDTLAAYLGYRDFDEFIDQTEQPTPQQLVGCVGNWYYYTRESTGQDVLLRSPVRVWQEETLFFMELQGRHRYFQGELQFRQGGLFANLTAHTNEKQLHLVFQVGLAYTPALLQGVFSGYSSYFCPVAGRALLWRQAQPYEDLTIDRLDLRTLVLDPSPELPPDWPLAIVRHLAPYADNYIRVINHGGFELDSLT